jgi:hypothetical protein
VLPTKCSPTCLKQSMQCLSGFCLSVMLHIVKRQSPCYIVTYYCFLFFSCRATQCLVLSVCLSVRLSVPNFVPDFVPNFCPRFYSQTTRRFVHSKSPSGLSMYKCTEAGINSCITVRSKVCAPKVSMKTL